MLSIRTLLSALATTAVLGAAACSAEPESPAPDPGRTETHTVEGGEASEVEPQGLCPRRWVCYNNNSVYLSGSACASACPGGGDNCELGCIATGACFCPD